MHLRVRSFCAAAVAATLTFVTSTFARDEGPAVAYYPQTETVEGDQPLYHTYELEITSPSNLPAGSSVTIHPVLFVTRAPEGVSDAQALSHVSIESLVFTGPNQKQYATVVCDFPVGTQAGNYGFGIRTPGWGVVATDTFGFINAKVLPPRPHGAPTVKLNSPLHGAVFTWHAGGPAVAVPVQFDATAPATSPLTTLDADISGTGVSLTVTGLNTTQGSASGTFYLAQPGLFTVSARASNIDGTATDFADFTVVVEAPPPTVAISSPAANASYTIVTGGTVSVPFAFSAESIYGNLSELTATVNDVPVTFTPSGLNTLSAHGSANLSISNAGTHVLAVSARNPYGTTSVTSQFTVTVVEPTPPPPSVTITSPAQGTIITRVAGSAPTAVPYTFTATTTAPWTISSVGASLSGNPLAVLSNGLGTAIAGGTGTLYVSGPGTYSLVATGSSGGSTSADSITFTVVETTPPPPEPACGVNWLPPIQHGKTEKGGSTVSIKFELNCHDDEVGEDRNGDGEPDFFPGQRTKSKDNIDYSVVIAIYEIFPNGTTSTPRLFPYSGSPNAPGYTIQGNDKYHLNFVTAKGAHRYQIEVYHDGAGDAPVLLATRQLLTK